VTVVEGPNPHQDRAGRLKVVVVTYNSARVLPGLLASLPRSLEDIGSCELVVVDNASTDDSLEVARAAAPGATLVALEENLGYAAGINAGVAAGCSADAVLILNPDVRLGPGSIRALLEALEVPGTGIVVPRMVDGDGTLYHSLRREPTVLRALGEALLGGDRAGRFPLLSEVVRQGERYETAGTFDWATGAVMGISRRCLEAVGPWDESFFLYSEETDFALRARDAGFALRYTPAAEVVHLGGDSGVSPALWSLLTRNRVKLYRRRHGPARTALFGAAVALNEALRALAGRATHASALRGLLHAGRRSLPGGSPPTGAP
jgi:N-acetylglucosaminyl-diphospho-decaprenol L-rhamnosyltransferase